MVAELQAYAPPPVGLDSTLDGFSAWTAWRSQPLLRLDEALGVGLPTV